MTGIDPTIVVAAMTLVGTLAGILISRGTETRRIITGAPEGYAKLVEDLQQERDRQDSKIDALADEVASMRTRMRGLESGQDTDRRLIEILRSHINELRSALRRAGIVPPPAPAGSGVEDSGEHLAASPA